MVFRVRCCSLPAAMWEGGGRGGAGVAAPLLVGTCGGVWSKFVGLRVPIKVTVTCSCEVFKDAVFWKSFLWVREQVRAKVKLGLEQDGLSGAGSFLLRQDRHRAEDTPFSCTTDYGRSRGRRVKVFGLSSESRRRLLPYWQSFFFFILN